MARSTRGPLVALVIVALLPAIGLGWLWRWALAQDLPPDPSELVPVTPEPDGPPSPELSTSLASLRRLPAPLAAERAERDGRERREQQLGGLFVDLPDEVVGSSCARVELDGEVLLDLGPERTVIPASTMKLLIGSVALEVVGPDVVAVTELRGPAPVDGVIPGDLFLIGGGDPLLRSDEVPIPRRLEVVEPTRVDDLVDQLIALGVRRIEGALVGDGTRYDDEFIVPSWGSAITRDDGGPIGALLVNDGRIVGSGVGLNPSQSAVNELARLLNGRGVSIGGGNHTGAAPDGLELLGSVTSAPVGDLVEEMLVTSDNQIAEMLLKEIGHIGAGEGSRPAGMAVVREVLTTRGVDLTGASLEDGSGLSRVNAVTCSTLVDLLTGEPFDGALAAALPVAGERGTLANVLLDDPAEGLLRAKTGTLTGVKALAGYVPAPAGRTGQPDQAGEAGEVGEVGEAGEAVRFAILLEGVGANDPTVHEPVWAAMVAALIEPWPEPEPERFGPR